MTTATMTTAKTDNVRKLSNSKPKISQKQHTGTVHEMICYQLASYTKARMSLEVKQEDWKWKIPWSNCNILVFNLDKIKILISPCVN